MTLCHMVIDHLFSENFSLNFRKSLLDICSQQNWIVNLLLLLLLLWNIFKIPTLKKRNSGRPKPEDILKMQLQGSFPIYNSGLLCCYSHYIIMQLWQSRRRTNINSHVILTRNILFTLVHIKNKTD